MLSTGHGSALDDRYVSQMHSCLLTDGYSYNFECTSGVCDNPDHLHVRSPEPYNLILSSDLKL